MSPKHFNIAWLLALLMLVGCTVGPDYERPDAEMDAQFHELRRDAGLTTDKPAQLANWWTTFDDPALNKLIKRAVRENLDLRDAASRLRQARALRSAASGQRFPTLNASGSAQRTRASDNARPAQARGGDLTTDLYSAGFDAGWELDLFGGIERSVEAAEADIGAAAEFRRNVLVSVLAEVALNYVEARGYQERLSIARNNLKRQTATFKLVESRNSAGLVRDIDLERARANMADTRARIPDLSTRLTRARNRLTTLLGDKPGALDTLFSESEPVPEPPIEVAIGVPADLLRRRPDIRRAERVLAAETARVGVATAELYPKLRLTGSIGLESLTGSNLFETASRTFGIGSIVDWPIFSGDQIRSRIRAQSEVQQQAYIGWQSTVLSALEEVDNVTTAYANEQLRHASLERSTQSAVRAARLARSRYESGVADFIEVLDANRERLSAQDQLAASKAEVATDLIRLYKALGGGWQSLAADGSSSPARGQPDSGA